MIQSYTSILNEVSDIYYPNTNTLVVKTFYLDGEVLYSPTPSNQSRINENWFILTHYPDFVSTVASKNITPSVYFLPNAYENIALDDNYIDLQYPILNNHRSMYWVYRSLKFMIDNNLPIPERIDMSIYPKTLDSSKFDEIINRVLDDADAVLSSLGIPSNYGIAETFYFDDINLRTKLIEALHNQSSYIKNYRLKRASIWTTPYRGNGSYLDGTEVGWPLHIDEYKPN